jgi:hypothetical protein
MPIPEHGVVDVLQGIRRATAETLRSGTPSRAILANEPEQKKIPAVR